MPTPCRPLATLLLSAALFAALPADASTAAIPEEYAPGIRLTRDVAYGGHRRQRFDVYARQGLSHAPAIVMIHGGAWRGGDKRNPGVLGAKLTHWIGRDHVFISVNTRLSPVADPIEQARDLARAVAAAQRNAALWGADPERFVLMGHSAGAHLVALLLAMPGEAHRLGMGTVRGAVLLDAGALDVPAIMRRRHLPLYDRAFGADPAFWLNASPLHRLHTPTVPLLLVCASTRPAAPCDEAEALATRARALGGVATVRPEALGHVQINTELGEPGPYTEAVTAFIDRVVGADD
ncbi:MAG: alpha/beta hydrolase [Rhodocyclaceae bacterium]|nr:alpha/beta hydrolase [Rhodocyclaceae bacterium]